MSDSFREKRACKNKRLTGNHFDDEPFSISERYGNKRKSMQKEKIRDRRAIRRLEKSFFEVED